MDRYKIDFITPKGNILITINSTLDFTNYVFGHMDVVSKCDFVVTNLDQNKVYEPISIKQLIDMAHPDNDLDTLLLTTQYIGDDTLENKKVPIDILYMFVGKIQVTSIQRAEGSVNRVLANDLKFRQETMANFNKSINLIDNKEETYIQPLTEDDLINFNFTVNELPEDIKKSIDYLNISNDINVIEKIAEWKKKEKTVRSYIRSWMPSARI